MRQILLDVLIVFSFIAIMGLFFAYLYFGDISGDFGWNLLTILGLLSFVSIAFQIIFYFYVKSIVGDKRSSKKLHSLALNRWSKFKHLYFFGSTLFYFTDLRNCYFGRRRK